MVLNLIKHFVGSGKLNFFPEEPCHKKEIQKLFERCIQKIMHFVVKIRIQTNFQENKLEPW